MNKKKLFLICIAMISLLMTGCIFKNPPVLRPAFVTEDLTVERLFEAATNKVRNARTVSERQSTELEMDLSMMGQKISMTMSAEIAIDSQGKNHHIEMKVSALAYGQTQSQSVEMYVVPGDIDEKVVVYQNTGSGWTSESTSASPVNVKDAESILTPELAARMTLQPETAQFNGEECHVVTGKVEWEDLTSYVDLSQLTESFGEDIELDLSDISFEVIYYFSAADMSLKGTSLDCGDAIAEVFNRVFKALAGMDVGIEIPAFTAECTIDYDIVDEVTVPEEVQNEAGGA